ncbi:hypothetical protein [Kitasatospora sp. NPDC059462]|uniref:hypothetical protein n=1 Tax=Kitasatospora sp. NPDC059462 TaxID=3346841 RepID=UPI003696D102
MGYVKPYFRKDGTFVSGHYRSNPSPGYGYGYGYGAGVPVSYSEPPSDSPGCLARGLMLGAMVLWLLCFLPAARSACPVEYDPIWCTGSEARPSATASGILGALAALCTVATVVAFLYGKAVNDLLAPYSGGRHPGGLHELVGDDQHGIGRRKTITLNSGADMAWGAFTARPYLVTFSHHTGSTAGRRINLIHPITISATRQMGRDLFSYQAVVEWQQCPQWIRETIAFYL